MYLHLITSPCDSPVPGPLPPLGPGNTTAPAPQSFWSIPPRWRFVGEDQGFGNVGYHGYPNQTCEPWIKAQTAVENWANAVSFHQMKSLFGE